jgi:hypothetical protein
MGNVINVIQRRSDRKRGLGSHGIVHIAAKMLQTRARSNQKKLVRRKIYNANQPKALIVAGSVRADVGIDEREHRLRDFGTESWTLKM